MSTPGPVHVEQTHVVGDGDTAAALGSGSLPVLATPRLLAWCEAATCAALEPVLGAGDAGGTDAGGTDAGGTGPRRTSVGTRVELQHSAASPVGADVVVTADPSHSDGRLHRFRVSARHTDGKLVATGEVTRVVVDVDRFLGRL